MVDSPPKLHIPKAGRQDWETPTDTFDYLDDRFGPFDLDAACQPDQITAMKILARGGRILIPPDGGPQYGPPVSNWTTGVLERISEDGLTTPWEGKKVWLNPPFNGLADWLPKAIEEVDNGIPDMACVLMPARTDTKYWQDYVIKEVRRTSDVVPWADREDGIHRDGWNVDAHPALFTVVNLPGRLTFIGADGPYTQPCCAVIYGHNVHDKEHQ